MASFMRQTIEERLFRCEAGQVPTRATSGVEPQGGRLDSLRNLEKRPSQILPRGRPAVARRPLYV